MFYKVLIIECLAIIGLVSIRVHQALPATEITVGEHQIVIKESVVTPTAAIVANPADAPVSELPKRPIAPLSAAANLAFPVAGHGPENVISIFGDKRGKTRLHKGIDVKAPKGTEVVATTTGFIERINEGGSGGKQIYLRGAKGRLFYYAHLNDWLVEEFEAVEAGQAIGTVGDTGNAKGTTPHLHFEIMVGKKKKAIDPLLEWVRP